MEHLTAWHPCKADPTVSRCFCSLMYWDQLISHIGMKIRYWFTLGLCLYLVSRWGYYPFTWWDTIWNHSLSVSVWWPIRSSWHSVSLQTWNIKPLLDYLDARKFLQIKGKPCYPLKPVTWVGSGAHKTISVEKHPSVVISVAHSLTDTEVTGTE